MTMNYKHGKNGTRLYRIWANMKNRCKNPKSNRAHVYLNRGITVCDEWKDDFQVFYDWSMSHGYSDDLTIDRIDNDKGYSPDNCRWVTHSEQMRNTSQNHMITFAGKTQTIGDWAMELGINHQTLCARVNDYGWTVERALTTPVRKGGVSDGT